MLFIVLNVENILIKINKVEIDTSKKLNLKSKSSSKKKLALDKKLLNNKNLTKEEIDSIIRIIQTSYAQSSDSSDEWLAVNFFKSLTNSNVKVNILELLQKFNVEDLSNCMRAGKKIDIDTLVIEEIRCC